MSSVSAPGRSSGKTIIAVVLVVIAVLAIVAGIIYFIEPAKSLPSILGTITHPPSRANSTRSLRGAGCMVVAVIALVAAFFVYRGTKSSPDDSRDTVDAASRS